MAAPYDRMFADLKALLVLVLAVVAGLFVAQRAWTLPPQDALSDTLFNLMVTAVLSLTAHSFSALAERWNGGPPTLSQLGLVGVASVLVGGETAVHLGSWGWNEPPEALRAPILSTGAVIMAAVLVVAMLTDRARLAVEVARLQAAESELALLRARLRPHFLFNSLNTIAGLIPIAPERAERATEDLSMLLRFVLEATASERVPLAEELAAVQAYLAIQQERFEERLVWAIDVEEAATSRPVPPMILQPLVENAVVHAVATQAEPVHLVVRGTVDEHGLHLVVEDDGIGPANPNGNGTALRDLERRLALLPSPGTLQVGSLPDGGFRAQLHLPDQET